MSTMGFQRADTTAEQMDRAAIVIQAQFRRYKAQKQYRKQQEAAGIIQAQTARFLARRQAAGEHEREQKAARFKAVMARHQERIQQLELQKRRIRELPLDQLDAWQAKRHTAATKIQACWRGSRQRQELKVNCPALAALRPVSCRSPTLMDRPPAGNRDQQQGHRTVKNSVTAAGFTAGLQQEPSSASTAAADPAREYLRGSKAGLLCSSNLLAGQIRAEPSSCSTVLMAEASKLLVVGAAVMEASEGPKRSAAIPAARHMVMERQVQLRIDGFKAANKGSNKLAALRAAREATDQRLVQLLQDHQATAAANLKAARRRQKLLQEAEILHGQLQQLPQLSQLPADADADASQFPRPPAGTAAAEAARQAHALALAEARVGSRWWLPLKLLNQQHKDAAAAAGGLMLQQEWKQQEAAWKDNWAKIWQEEQQRGAGLGLKQQGQQAMEVVIEQELSSGSWHVAT